MNIRTSFYLFGVLCVIGFLMFVWYYQKSAEPKVLTLDDGTVLTLLTTTPPQSFDTTAQESYEGNYFEHKRYGFKILIPNGFSGVEQLIGNASAVMLFRDDLDNQKSFQIFVTPYGKQTIAKERFSQDLGSGATIKKMRNVTLGEQSIEAIVFESDSPLLGLSYEIWFVHNNFLYEISTKVSDQLWVDNILSTLIFI